MSRADVTRTYLDTGVLIAAFRGGDESHDLARRIIDDPDRELIGSQYLELELIPKPTFCSRSSEIDFMRAAIDGLAQLVQSSPALSRSAVDIAGRYDLTPIDALHIAAAIQAGAAEFVTTEGNTKPYFKVREITCVSIKVRAPGLPPTAAG